MVELEWKTIPTFFGALTAILKTRFFNKQHQAIIGIDVDREANMQNIACLGKTMSLCKRQHLAGSIH